MAMAKTLLEAATGENDTVRPSSDAALTIA